MQKNREERERSREKEGVRFTGGVLLCQYPKAGFNKTSIWLSHRATSSKTSQQPSSPPQSIFGGLWKLAWTSLLPQQDRAFYWVRPIESISLLALISEIKGDFKPRGCAKCALKNLATEKQLLPMCQSTNKAKGAAETLHGDFTEWGSLLGSRRVRTSSLGGSPMALQPTNKFPPTQLNLQSTTGPWPNQHRVKTAQNHTRLHPTILVSWPVSNSGARTISTK